MAPSALSRCGAVTCLSVPRQQSHARATGASGLQTSIRPTQPRFLHRLRRCTVTAASNPKKEEATSAASAKAQDDDLLPIERELRPQCPAPAAQAKRKPKKRVKVSAPAVEEAKGQRPASPASQFEGSVLSLLSVLGVLVLVIGVFLAASGFLPEEVDNFSTKYIYPAYTPFVGVFLAFSTGYGVWKSRQ